MLMLRLVPLTEVVPRGFPLWYQVTVGVGIPSTTQVKVTDCPTILSRSSSGDIVIVGGTVLREGGREGHGNISEWLGRKLNNTYLEQ